MRNLLLMPLIMPLMLPGGFDGVEPLKEDAHNFIPGSCRALAKVLGRSPSHICRVMRGERVSRRLAAQLRRCGVKIST